MVVDENKIEINGKVYIPVEPCIKCHFYDSDIGCMIPEAGCTPEERKDEKDVIWIEQVEK